MCGRHESSDVEPPADKTDSIREAPLTHPAFKLCLYVASPSNHHESQIGLGPKRESRNFESELGILVIPSWP